MAKNDISSIVFKAVVDTSGVAAGLNNIGAQVAGRQFGTGGGGPMGASGAAGGFVNPHGGGAGPGVAAVAAAAAAGAGLGRGGRPGATGPATGAGAGFRSVNEPLRNLYARAGQGSAILGNPLTTMLHNRFQQPLLQRANALFDAANMAREAGSRTASDLYSRQGNRIRANFDRRNAALARLAQSRTGRAAGGAYGALRGIGQGLGGMNNRFGSMLGLGRFAPLGLPGMAVAGAGMAAIQFGQMGNEGMPSRFSDISRFQPGDDRYLASLLKQTWAPSGQKAPLSFIDRMFVEGRRANQGEPTFLERALKSAGENYQQLATTTGQASAGDFDAIMALLRNLTPATALGLPDVFTTLRRLSM